VKRPAAPELGFAGLAAAVVVSALLACGARVPAPPPQTPTAAETPPDGGLPVPPPSGKKGVVVPSDVGLGEGASGPERGSGTIPPTSPTASQASPIGN
jgi:hypothetical protein